MQLIEDLWQFLKAETLLGNCLMLFKYMKLHGMHLPKGEKKTEKRVNKKRGIERIRREEKA